jgi:hypothetical protein
LEGSSLLFGRIFTEENSGLRNSDHLRHFQLFCHFRSAQRGCIRKYFQIIWFRINIYLGPFDCAPCLHLLFRILCCVLHRKQETSFLPSALTQFLGKKLS